jgi:hypothetical protein
MTAHLTTTGLSAKRLRRDAKQLELAATHAFERAEDLLDVSRRLNTTAREMLSMADALDDADDIERVSGMAVDVVLSTTHR